MCISHAMYLPICVLAFTLWCSNTGSNEKACNGNWFMRWGRANCSGFIGKEQPFLPPAPCCSEHHQHTVKNFPVKTVKYWQQGRQYFAAILQCKDWYLFFTAYYRFLGITVYDCRITWVLWLFYSTSTLIYLTVYYRILDNSTSTVGELWVRVILRYMPVCYKICYFCICINPHQSKNKVCRASQIPSPRLPHSSRQSVNIQKSYNKHTNVLPFSA